jgi:hypothetical protein
MGLKELLLNNFRKITIFIWRYSMQLKHVSDEALDQSLLAFVKKEKEVLKDILLHIVEVDRRRLYLRMAYPSLFAYLTEHIGYAAGSAQRRIDAARLSQEVPSVIQDLEAGHLNLSQVTLLQKAFREHKRRDKNTTDNENHLEPQIALKETKVKLLTELKHKSYAESQVLVAKALQIKIKESPKVHYQSDESVRLEVSLSKKQWIKLQEMRRILSNSLPNGSWDQALENAADTIIEQESKGVSSGLSSEPANKPEIKTSIRKLKQMALFRDKCCQYKDPKTGKVCGTNWYLETDHLQPRWAGGKDELKNYRALCSAHNKEVYRQQSGIRRV